MYNKGIYVDNTTMECNYCSTPMPSCLTCDNSSYCTECESDTFLRTFGGVSY